MKTYMYCIYDKKGQIYEPPRHCINMKTAQRMFYVIFGQKNSMYNRFPTDYEVYLVGEFDDNTCLITPVNPRFMWNGAELIKEKDIEGKSVLLQTDQNRSEKELQSNEQNQPRTEA